MRKQSLLANSTVVVLAQAWGMVLTLSITPYVYRSLGPEGYGLFALVLVLANYLTIVDFGFGWGVIKFVAEYAAKGEAAKMAGVVRICVWTSVGIGVLLGAALACLAPWLARSVLNVSAERAGVVTVGIALGGGIAVGLLLNNVLAGVLKGLQRYDLAVGLRSLSTTARMIGYVLLLRAGAGLVGLWVLTVATMLACGLAYRLCIRRLVPGLSLWPTLDRSSFKTVFSFSAFGFGTRLLTMPYYYLDKLFISSLLPVAALAHYVIPFNLAQKVGGVGCLAVSVLFPSASERAHEPARLRSFYRRTLPVAYALILPMVLAAVTVGPTFLGYWIDPEFAARARLPMILLVAGMGALVLGTLDGTFLEGTGRPQVRTVIYAALAAVSLPMCYLLTRRFGINGTALTVCLAFSLGGALEVLTHQVLVVKDWWYTRRVLPRAAAVVALALAAGWCARPLISGLCSAIVVGALLYGLLALVALRLFHTGEQFKAHLARARGAARGVAARLRPRSLVSARRQAGN